MQDIGINFNREIRLCYTRRGTPYITGEELRMESRNVINLDYFELLFVVAKVFLMMEDLFAPSEIGPAISCLANQLR
jgi:hypothetical protein